MAARTLFFLIATGLLAGCATPDPVIIREPVEVRVPVPVRAKPPEELLTPYKPASLPQFVAPTDEAATAALTEEGLTELRAILRDLTTLESAWRAWATEPVSEQPN